MPVSSCRRLSRSKRAVWLVDSDRLTLPSSWRGDRRETEVLGLNSELFPGLVLNFSPYLQRDKANTWELTVLHHSRNVNGA